MKSILLIGMGKFGQTLGERLLNMGDEVMIVDKNEDIVNTLAPKYTNALIANCMNENRLRLTSFRKLTSLWMTDRPKKNGK